MSITDLGVMDIHFLRAADVLIICFTADISQRFYEKVINLGGYSFFRHPVYINVQKMTKLENPSCSTPMTDRLILRA